MTGTAVRWSNTCFNTSSPSGASRFLRMIAAAALALATSQSRAADSPNIVFLLADDVGWNEMASDAPTNKVATPTLSALAAEGIRFTDAHASAAVCSPSRYAIVTGNYQWRGAKKFGEWGYKSGSNIRPEQLTLGSMLRRAGYATAFVGKWHQGSRFYQQFSNSLAKSNTPDDTLDFDRPIVDGPLSFGFDYTWTLVRSIHDSPFAHFENDLLVGRDADMRVWNKGKYGDTVILRSGIGIDDWNTRSVGPTLLSSAMAFIDAAVPPFFLLLATEAAHTPAVPPDSIAGRPVAGASGVSARADMLVETDAMLAAIIDRLQSLGQLQNTLFIVSSDNGAPRISSERKSGHYANGALRGFKGTIYEAGHRVPLIMQWGQDSAAFAGSTRPRGSVIDDLVGLQDIYATLAALTGVELGANEALDSINLLPLIRDPEAAPPRTTMIQEANRGDSYSPDPISGRHKAFRAGSWKLVFDSANRPVGLYDLASDAEEKSNVLADEPARVAEMQAQFNAQRNSPRTR